MSALNVPLESLVKTDDMDLSHRGTPLTPVHPEHYTNKQYVDDTLADIEVRSPAAVPIACDGIATNYTVAHNLGTVNIASVQIYETTGGKKNPIGISWEPTTADTITLKPDVLLPVTMTLLIIVNA